MKRPIFIIAGVIMVFILLLVWLYVLFFSTPNNTTEDEFTNLELGDTTDTITANTIDQQPLVDVFAEEALKQLTTKQVAGYQVVQQNASSSPQLYYVEVGTGNIFAIDFENGDEERVSKTTVPNTVAAEITPDGQFVMFQAGYGLQTSHYIGVFSTSSDEVSISYIDQPISNFKATKDNDFLYAITTNTGVIAKSYEPNTRQEGTLFSVPFREAQMVWGETSSETHYIHPKAARALEGYVYKTDGDQVSRLSIDGYGLSAVGLGDQVIYSNAVAEGYDTFVYNPDTGSQQLAFTIIPEKCVFVSDQPNTAYCALSFGEDGKQLPDSWYKGATNYSDNIWKVDTVTPKLDLIAVTKADGGRELDITRLDYIGEDLYFINKKDHTLWVFDTTTENQ